MESIKVTREEVKHFLSIVDNSDDGYGFGPDTGYGLGDGSGYSDGSGVGYGLGDGFGEGDSSGYGSGDRVGSGFSSGYGYGDNFVECECEGYGYYNYGHSDIKAFNGNIVDYIDNIPTIITHIHNNIARGYIINKDLTVELCYIAKVGNSFAYGNTIKDAVSHAETKELNKVPVKERINKFKEAFGSLDSEHTGKEFYDWHHILTGSCRMGRDEFCKSHNIDLEKKYTVRYFIDITKNSYGGDVIKLIEEDYENMEE